MKTVSFIFKKILYPGCAFFTLIWFLVCVVVDTALDIVNVNLSSAAMCFFIALAIAGSNLILHKPKLPFVGRFFLHMALSVFSVSIIVAVFSALFDNIYVLNSRSFYLVLLLIVLYLIIGTPTLLVYHRFYLSKKEKQA